MSRLAPITYHGVSLRSDFPDMDALLDSFMQGCPGRVPRVRLAVFSTVVSMFFHQMDTPDLFDAKKLAACPGASERLAYACLFALQNTFPGEKKEALKAKFLIFKGIFTGEVFTLLSQDENGFRGKTSFDEEGSAFCHIDNKDICLGDVKKIVDWK